MWIVLALVVGNLVGVIVGALLPASRARCTVPYVAIASLGAIACVAWAGPWLGVADDGWRATLALALGGALAPVVALHAAALAAARGAHPGQPQGAG